jgi:hypothetical protein
MTNILHAEPRDDDDDLLVGNRAMAEFATAEGCPTSTSTMQKSTSPAINTGPTLVGYFGTKPTTTKGLMRVWLRSRVRPVGVRAAQREQVTVPADMEARG